MRVHYLQHVPFEGPAAIGDWARASGHTLTGTHLYEGDTLPAYDEFDLLVVLGGPMGVADTDEYPHLRDELGLVADCHNAGTPVLGICLGAQLVAAALDAEVYPHDVTEIGWFPVEPTADAPGSPLDVSEPFPALHWHGDTFDLPDGATLLARTDACETQAFVHDRSVGLQFHLEATPESVRALLDASGDLPDGEWVQSPERLLDDAAYEETHALLYDLLDGMAAMTA